MVHIAVDKHAHLSSAHARRTARKRYRAFKLEGGRCVLKMLFNFKKIHTFKGNIRPLGGSCALVISADCPVLKSHRIVFHLSWRSVESRDEAR